MKSNNLTLGAILNSPNQYVIPVFQRYYRWDQPEWEKLWADLTELQQPGKTGRHFLGFLVLVPESVMPGQICKYHLIDGQQRLTTLSLVLCALCDAAAAHGHHELAQEVRFTTLEHQFKKGTDRYRLHPKLRDRDQYVACLGGELPRDGRIAAAVRYFSGRLTTIPGAGTDEALRAFFDLLTQRLEFIYAQLENENPFNIFKSLNSTGVPLGQSDLIRNFVFMQVPVEDQDEFDETLWKPIERRFENADGNIDESASSAFLRDYLMRNGRYVSPSETFDVFQRHFEATDFDPKQVASDLKQDSESYAIIRGQQRDSNPEVEEALEALRRLDSSTTSSLLLNLFQRRHRKQLSDPDLAEALRLLSGFIVRRLVCNESSRAYARLFVQAIPALGDEAVKGLRTFLEDRGFPDTPRFVEAFIRFNLYGSRYKKAVLEELERASEHKEPVVLTTAQVEHVMPQTLSEPWRAALGPDFERVHSTWLHTPGNLTLTGYNAELTNKPFEAKREEYKGSNIVMTRKLAEFDGWGEAQIEDRGRAMADVAARVWPGPAAPIRRADDKSKSSASRSDLRLRYWNGFREYLEALGSSIKPRQHKSLHSLTCARLAPGAVLYAYLTLKYERIVAGVYFDGEAARRIYHNLREHQADIEAEVGSKLVWVNKPGTRSAEIVLRNPVDPTNETLWPSYYDWMRRSLETFQHVIGSRIPKDEPADPKENTIEGLTPTRAFQLSYWSALCEYVRTNSQILRPWKPQPRAWATFGIGRSGFVLTAVINKTMGWAKIQLYLDGPKAKVNYDRLARHKGEIEADLGRPVDWSEAPGKLHSEVALRRDDVKFDDHEDWPSQHRWFVENLESFHRAFAPRIMRLDAEPEEPPAQAPL